MSNNTEYKIQNTKHKKGFTLIEMLIVISIIAFLSSIFLVNLGGARSQARDARRITDLHNVQNSLELFYTISHQYPTSTNYTTLKTVLIGTLGISRVPDDPVATQHYEYGTATPYQSYVLKATLENSNNSAVQDDIDGTVYGIQCGTQGPAEKEYCVQP